MFREISNCAFDENRLIYKTDNPKEATRALFGEGFIAEDAFVNQTGKVVYRFSKGSEDICLYVSEGKSLSSLSDVFAFRENRLKNRYGISFDEEKPLSVSCSQIIADKYEFLDADNMSLSKALPFNLYLKTKRSKILDVFIQTGFFYQNVDSLFSKGEAFGIHAWKLGVDSSVFLPSLYFALLEKETGYNAPPRAVFLRVLFIELTRILSHFSAIEMLLTSIGMAYPFKETIALSSFLQSRCSKAFSVFGGVSSDISEEDEDAIEYISSKARECLLSLERGVLKNPVLIGRMKNKGVISKEDARRFSVKGFVLRASGIEEDSRLGENILGYENFNFDIPTSDFGDAYSRLLVLAEEIRQSIRIVEQAILYMPKGKIISLGDKNGDEAEKIRIYNSLIQERGFDDKLRIVKGEGARGECVLTLFNTVHLSLPSLNHALALSHILKEHATEDVALISSSLELCAFEVDS